MFTVSPVAFAPVAGADPNACTPQYIQELQTQVTAQRAMVNGENPVDPVDALELTRLRNRLTNCLELVSPTPRAPSSWFSP